MWNPFGKKNRTFLSLEFVFLDLGFFCMSARADDRDQVIDDVLYTACDHFFGPLYCVTYVFCSIRRYSSCYPFGSQIL